MQHSYSYKEEQRYDWLCREILDGLPSFYSHYASSFLSQGRSKATLYAYLLSILSFYTFLLHQGNGPMDGQICHFSIDTLKHISENDLQEYQDYLTKEQGLSASRTRQHFSALSSVYRFLNKESLCRENPFLFFEIPERESSAPLASLSMVQIQKVLTGILENRLYLAKTDTGRIPLPIPDSVFVRREPLVLRNHAIMSLLLATDIRLSELCGLDVMDFQKETGELLIYKKSTLQRTLLLPDFVSSSLSSYLYTSPVVQPSGLLSARQDVVHWCSKHLTDFAYHEHLKKSFPDELPELYAEAETFMTLLRRTGRSGLLRKRSEQALFLSSRGSVLTPRMVQFVFEESVGTHLPDLAPWGITPEKLRCSYKHMS